MKKKILFVITKSNWGGAQRYVYDLATSLPREKFDVAVALGGTGQNNAHEGLLALKLREKNVRTIFIDAFMRDISLGKDIAALKELTAFFKKERPDVVHLNSSKAAGLGSLAGQMAGVKNIIYTVHGWPFWEARNAVARGLIWFFSWMTVILSHKVICISDYDARVAMRMPFAGHRVVRIYNGIDTRFPLGTADVVRHSFPNGVRITGTIGELTRNKNQISLIEQAKNDPNMYVAIVGEGEDRRYLIKKIEEYGLRDRVKIFGFHWASEVLRGFDVFALPSIKEGLPYVLLEAKAAGLPFVANRVGGVGEILDNKDPEKFSLERMVKETTKLYS